MVNINGMFHNCFSLKYSGISAFKTVNVIDMICLFDECTFKA